MGKCCNPMATKYMELLNEQKGWNLVGGSKSKEYSIRSMETASGRFYFDGFDEGRMIFFEYDEPAHESPEYKERDLIKENRLKEHLKERNKSGTLVRYSEKYNKLTEKKI